MKACATCFPPPALSRSFPARNSRPPLWPTWRRTATPPRFRSTNRFSPFTTMRPESARPRPFRRRRLPGLSPVCRPACPARSSSAPRLPIPNKEYQWSGRVDHNFSDKDRGYIRVLRDNGFQPTYTSPFGPTFNDQSNQPQMSGQVSEMHTFGPNTVNQFNGSALFYAAIFAPVGSERRAGGAADLRRSSPARRSRPWARWESRRSLRLLFPAGTARVPVSDHGRFLSRHGEAHASARVSAGCTTTSPIWISRRSAARSTARSPPL